MPYSIAAKILFGDHVLTDHFAPDQVLLNDTFEDGRCALPVPGAVGHDRGDWARFADITAFHPQTQNPSFAGKA